MNVFDSKNYRDFVQTCLKADKRRGAVKNLALYLRCHSTYVSQVTKGKADLSVDQGLAFCTYFKLNEEETEFFLDLLNRDRAGSKATRAHYQTRIDRRKRERLDLKKRLKMADNLSAEDEAQYFRSWVPQAVHSFCQLPGWHQAEGIASRLKIDEDRVVEVLKKLETLGFVENSTEGYRSIRDVLHLGKNSPLIGQCHSNWRQKAIHDISASSVLPGVHYSSIVSMSGKTGKKVQELIYSHIEDTRQLVLPSEPESLFIYNIDFYEFI